jgi:hypothetical protein
MRLVRMSALGRKADMADPCHGCPLMTLSGHNYYRTGILASKSIWDQCEQQRRSQVIALASGRLIGARPFPLQSGFARLLVSKWLDIAIGSKNPKTAVALAKEHLWGQGLRSSTKTA